MTLTPNTTTLTTETLAVIANLPIWNVNVRAKDGQIMAALTVRGHDSHAAKWAAIRTPGITALAMGDTFDHFDISRA